ncbi:MAG: thiol:disulfide interchange protein DsbA/DsbL [Methylophilaceae bacterium]|nr:thiol:disulfide interchange protein DsbA/DsbL [Methylophilaceae bacterium]
MKKFLATLMLLLSTQVFADAPAAAPKQGVDFDATVQTIQTDNPAKIEVVELFWYGCSHCYHMDPVLNAWVKKQAGDVAFKRIPGLPNASWAPMARAYYAMETLGMLEKLHTPLFDVIHKAKTLNPTDEVALIAWITNQSGLDKVKVEAAYRSFSMDTKLNRAAQYFRASGATGVPSIVIDGKFITSSTMAGDNDKALKVADYIIGNIRKDKAKKK